MAPLLTAPPAVARCFIVERRLGAYPPDADPIVIPIFGFAVFWAATAPATWRFVWLCLRRYPGRVPLWA